MGLAENYILADNQDVTCAGVKYYIKKLFPGAYVVRVADKKNLVEALVRHPSAVVVIDYTLFDLNSFDVLRNLVLRFSEARWVLFSDELSDGFIRRVHLEDNVGMVLKGDSGDELCEALKCAARGGRFLCRQITNFLSAAPRHDETERKLTPTETEILKLIATGLSVKEIAARRYLSAHTVTSHKKNIFRKLGVNNVFEATKYALRAGLVELAEYYI